MISHTHLVEVLAGDLTDDLGAIGEMLMSIAPAKGGGGRKGGERERRGESGRQIG